MKKPKPESSGTLLALTSQAMVIAQKIVEARGELTPELEDELAVNSKFLSGKVDAYVMIEERLKSEAEHFEARAKEFSALSKAFCRAKETLRERILYCLTQMGQDEIQGTEYRWKKQACAKRLCVNEELLPKDYLMVITQTVPDREKIKSVLADGFEIAGVSEEGGYAIRHYPAKTS
jgi:hypothetical protein